MRFYIGSGLQRVKPYVQFFGLYCWHGEITWRPVPGRMPLPALDWATDKVGGPESKSVTIGKPISSQLQHGNLYPSCVNPSRLPCLARQPVFSSSGPHVRSGRPTDRSAGLLVGRTRLSGMVVSLVGGDPGVPMSHKVRTDQGPGGPCQVDPTYQKPHRPASGPRDLIHNPGALEDLG
jgi:hypothetical protein